LNRTGYVEYMRDSEVVASIVAGEPEGLAVAYDRYAGDLYGYCRSLLQEPDDAADAVQDTFVIAASKLGGLREPDRLRAWLFSVARNECLHRLKSRRSAAPLQDAPEQADENADVGGAAERAEAIALVRAAADGLNDGERDVIQQLWHGLEVPEVAAVLGVSRNHAYALFSRAREQLEASVAVLLVGRAGRRDCAALDSLLGDWDGRLTARLRRRVGRHIDQCGTCSDRRRRELTPAMLYGVTPGAVIGLAAARQTPAAAAAHIGGPLAGVRDAVLRLAGNATPHAASLRIGSWHASGRSMHSFGANGFPKPAPTGHLAFLHRPHLPLSPITMVGGTAVAATATVVATVVAPPARPAPDTLGGRPPASAQLPAGATQPTAAGGFSPASGSPGPGNTLIRVTPSAGGNRGSNGSVLATLAAPVTIGPSATVSTGGDPAGVASASQDAGGTAAPTVAVTAGASVSTGTLTVSPTTVVLSGLTGGSVTLTASGGPVTWSISEPASLLGTLSVSPSSGTLDSGASVTVTISVHSLVSLDTLLTVEPDGQLVTVVLGVL
jgi:RNA polymerase sigma factor (sigma-70 family)